MYARKRDQIRLELGQINVDAALLEAERCSDAGDHRCDRAIEMIKIWSRNIEGLLADVVDGVVINKECTVAMLNGGVRGENGVLYKI
jgi:hypothetical protein